MLTMQGGHRDVNTCRVATEMLAMKVATEMITMQGGHRDVNNAGWPQRC